MPTILFRILTGGPWRSLEVLKIIQVFILWSEADLAIRAPRLGRQGQRHQTHRVLLFLVLPSFPEEVIQHVDSDVDFQTRQPQLPPGIAAPLDVAAAAAAGVDLFLCLVWCGGNPTPFELEVGAGTAPGGMSHQLLFRRPWYETPFELEVVHRHAVLTRVALLPLTQVAQNLLGIGS